MSRTYRVRMDAIVVVTIEDPSAIDRCVENHSYEGNPQPDERGSKGWRNVYYQLRTRDEVLEHLAFNAVANGIGDASRLDGWADLAYGAVDMDVLDASVLSIAEIANPK